MHLTHYTAIAATVLAVAAGTASAQQARADCWSSPVPSRDSASALGHRTATARPIDGRRPRIDGRLDDAIWCTTAPVTDFIQSRPRPGAIATLPTMVRVLYDDDALYVAVRLFDPHPDSIQAPYPRRDDETASDWVFLELDSRHDHRSGYSFGLNPRGVQVDGTWANDVNYDAAWNGVWEGAATIDSAGWTAEFRIPFSQMALGNATAGGTLPFGLNIYRYTPHRGETSNWSPRLPTLLGVVSRFNDLDGVLVPPRHVPAELMPYVATDATNSGANGRFPSLTAKSGADIRIRPTPNTAVAATIHPDFGQVEADPSQVNLTTFETFLAEQRPFFVEGGDVFNFDASLPFSARGTSFDEESPFYSRRIGGPPHGAVPNGFTSTDIPSATTLLGAARATGRSANGWSGGFFQGETGAVTSSGIDAAGTEHRVSLEPLTHFSMARGAFEMPDGRGGIGTVATLVERTGMAPSLDSVVPRSAVVAGMNGRLRFDNDGYEGTAFILASHLTGSSSAIRALRTEPRHGYDRSDSVGAFPFLGDTTHGAMDGIAAQAALARVQGRWKWGAAGRLVTQGFEVNDEGFQRNANWLLATANWKYERFLQGNTIRHLSVGSTQLGEGWTMNGDRRAAVANFNTAFDLRNYWGGTVSVDHEFSALDPEVLRGGPSLLMPPSDRWTTSLFTDSRKRWQVTLNASATREPVTHSTSAEISPGLTAFVTDRLQLGITPSYGSSLTAWQYVAQPTDALGHPRYILGALDQHTASLTTRATYAFSQHLTLQAYAQAFSSGGTYGQFLEVVSPRAAVVTDRIAAIDALRLRRTATSVAMDSGSAASFTFANPAFSDRDFHLNALLRYEYSPGSTLFLVWTQARTDGTLDTFGLSRDARRLWLAPADQVLLVKISYWLAR